MGAEDYKKEIVSMLEDVTDIPSLRFIYGATKSAYREEQAVRRIKDMERRVIAASISTTNIDTPKLLILGVVSIFLGLIFGMD